MAKRDTVTTYPNRGKLSSKIMRVVVGLMLLVSVGLMLIICLDGWKLLDGSKILIPVFMALYLLLVIRLFAWSRGVLPVAAGFAVIIGIFGGSAVTIWFSRDQPGYLDSDTSAFLGTMTEAFVLAQAVLLVVALIAFRQNWQTEVERNVDEQGNQGEVAARA